eukprot:463751_1
MDSNQQSSQNELQSPLHKLLSDENVSFANNTPVVTFNSTATVQQKLKVISHKFESFTKVLAQEKTKQLTLRQRKIQNFEKAVGQLQKLVVILQAARDQQIKKCKKTLDQDLTKWNHEHAKKYNTKLDELAAELNMLFNRLECMKKDFQQNHQQIMQLLESKMSMVSDRLQRFIQQYNEQQRMEYDQYNDSLQKLRDIDRHYFDIFQTQIKERESHLTELRENVSLSKLERAKSEEKMHVLMEKHLITIHKGIDAENVKRKETSDELFKQIQHYTKRIKSCLGNM